MDFFQHQQQARQRTGLLLFYFFLAVFLTVVAVNAVFYVATTTWTQPGLGIGGWLLQPYAGWMALTTVAVIGMGSLSTYLQLRQGGQVLAETVGARRIDTDSTDTQERMLLNIVEEMAIASGTPAPTVYVMDQEEGINAFVAGFAPTEAVLVVTRGALQSFSRDEMQGVIGHEFSHILNGDMRMNVHLYAILSGILAIGRIGEFLLRNAGRNRTRSRDDKGAGVLFALGLALMVVGYIGLFFGRLIKAAISRQREWLADASSVQFTRNPQGIGEALLKIRNAAHGSLLHNSHAEDMSHMCFSLPVNMRLAGLLATHPPLEERIGKLDASLLARDRARARKDNDTTTPVPANTSAPAGPAHAAGYGSAPAEILSRFSGGDAATQTLPPSASTTAAAPTGHDESAKTVATTLVESVGQLTPAHLALAHRLHASIPESVRDALRTPAGARIVAYAIIVAGTDAKHASEAQRQLASGDSPGIGNRLLALLPDVRRMGTRLYLPCLDLALPALRPMSADQKKKFVALLATLAQLDQRITLREYMVVAMMRKHLADNVGVLRPVRHRSYTSVAAQINTVMSLLCHSAGIAEEACLELHTRLLRGFGIGQPPLLPAAVLSVGVLQAALTELADLSPLLKRALLDACIDGVSHDGKWQVAEIELVRIIGDALDCPLPPWAGTPPGP